jgi:hypothetical protein
MTASRYLVDRQRASVPVDRRTMRRGESGGGVQVANARTLAVGIEDERARYPATVFDTQIIRDRGPYIQKDRARAAGDNWVNWSTSGPVRPSMHQRNTTFRTMVGNSASRFPFVDTPTGGMHTMTAGAVSRTVPRYVTVPQMVGARIGRLQPGQYAGQTYSQTTRLQGRPR